jgi:hypothetical protein
MRHILATTVIAALTLSLTACSGSAGSTAAPVTASAAFQTVSARVATAKLTTTVTADNDPNHLLGRPHQYTSKVTFSDSRIDASDVSGLKKDDALRGGAIEVFGSNADAKTRAAYIQEVTKSLPILAEYDFVHGVVLVRVSHYLTPKQAAGYDKAAADLG